MTNRGDVNTNGHLVNAYLGNNKIAKERNVSPTFE